MKHKKQNTTLDFTSLDDIRLYFRI